MNCEYITQCGGLNRRENYRESETKNMQLRLQSYSASMAEDTPVYREALAASKPVIRRHRFAICSHHTAGDEQSARAENSATDNIGFALAAEIIAPAFRKKRMRHRLLNRLQSNRDRLGLLLDFRDAKRKKS